MSFYLAHVKKPIGRVSFGEVYWVDAANAKHFKPFADIYPATIIKPYTNQKNLLVVRSGGIGDILALSALAYGKQPSPGGDGPKPAITLLTQKVHFTVVDWWGTPPKRLVDFDSPLFKLIYPQKMEDAVADYGMLYGEDAIELGSKYNWFEIFAAAANQTTTMGRPQLRDVREKYRERRLKPDSTLIVHRASSINRSARLSDMQKMATGIVYHYDDANNLLENGEIVGKTTTVDYLLDVYDADRVLSVDTSAHHFREGLGKPSVAFYGAFCSESRAKYYKYTDAVDVKSDCTLQPCHLPNAKPCPNLKKGDECVPCMKGLRMK